MWERIRHRCGFEICIGVLLFIFDIFQNVFYFALQKLTQGVQRMSRDVFATLHRIIVGQREPHLAQSVGRDTFNLHGLEQRLKTNHLCSPLPSNPVYCLGAVLHIYDKSHIPFTIEVVLCLFRCRYAEGIKLSENFLYHSCFCLKS